MSLEAKKDSSILILGAGSGAFDQRLLDAGYANITAVDFIETSYKVRGTKFIKRDLNEDFDDLGKFDYIFAIEVVEHLENQFHLVRNIRKCLNEGGYCFLSTPNITSKYSKANFIVKGELALFSRGDLMQTGHINIIAPHILEYNLEKNGLKVEKTTNEGKFSLGIGSIFSWRSFFGFVIYNVLMLFLFGKTNQINVYVTRTI